MPGGGIRGIPIVPVLVFVLTVAVAVEVFRRRTGTEEVPYELEFDFVAEPSRLLSAPDSELYGENIVLATRRTIFPRFLLGRRETLEMISEALQVDLWNAAGQDARKLFSFDAPASLAHLDR